MKKYVLGVCALALAVGFSAFTTKSAHNVKTVNDTYYFTGSDKSDFNSYTTSFQDCDGSTVPCQISAPTTSGHIDLSAIASGTETVLDRINDADAANQTNETVISLKD